MASARRRLESAQGVMVLRLTSSDDPNNVDYFRPLPIVVREVLTAGSREFYVTEQQSSAFGSVFAHS